MTSPFPDLKLLRIFATVVRRQGFALAQQELNLSTSAISTYMSLLESQLGLSLCHRGRGGFRLTSKGELLHAQTLRLLDQMSGFERYASELKGELRGTLHLGVIDNTVSDPALPLADTLGAFCRAHPAVHIHLSVMGPHDLQMGVVNNTLDLAIGSFFTRVNGLVSQPLHSEQHWLYCSDQHPLFARQRLTVELVTQYQIVRRESWIQNELTRHGFKHTSATVESMEAQLILVLSGAYTGYLPEHYARSWVQRGRLLALLPGSFAYLAPFALIYRRGRTREPMLLALREALQAQLANSVV